MTHDLFIHLLLSIVQYNTNTTYDIIKEKLRNHNIITLKDKSESHDIYDDVDVKEEIIKLMNRNTNIKK